MPIGVEPVASPSTADGLARTRSAMRRAIWHAISSYVSARTTGSRSANLAAPGAEHEAHHLHRLGAHHVLPQALLERVDLHVLRIEPGVLLEHRQEAAEGLDQELIAGPVHAAAGRRLDHELGRGQTRVLVDLEELAA